MGNVAQSCVRLNIDHATVTISPNAIPHYKRCLYFVLTPTDGAVFFSSQRSFLDLSRSVGVRVMLTNDLLCCLLAVAAINTVVAPQLSGEQQ